MLTAPVRSIGARTPSKVLTVAEALRAMILARPEGAPLGKEDDLCAQLDCTRPVLRQAARQMEVHGLLDVRRGPGGGYFGKRPSMEAVVDVAASYLISRGTTLEEACKAAISCSLESVRLAAFCDPASKAYTNMAQLYGELATKIPEDMSSEEFIRDEGRIESALYEMVGSPPLEMLIKIINKICLEEYGRKLFVQQPERRRRYRQLRLDTMKAVLAHDPDAAVAAMVETTRLIESWIPISPGTLAIGTRMLAA